VPAVALLSSPSKQSCLLEPVAFASPHGEVSTISPGNKGIGRGHETRLIPVSPRCRRQLAGLANTRH